MLNEDFTEVEWVRQTDQVLVIKDRCSARVAAPVPKEPEQLPGPNRARIVQERASTPLRLHRRQAWGQAGIYVGIDVAKAKVDVAVRPTGERWEVPRDEAGIPQLVSEMKTLGSREI